MHTISMACQGCLDVMRKYPNLHPVLFTWFTSLQRANPTAHVSCAGRGKVEQELDFNAKRSRARWGESAHNYNMAIDLFGLTFDGKADFSQLWYIFALSHNIPASLLWYGNEGPYREYPHIEVRGWQALRGEYHLVE